MSVLDQDAGRRLTALLHAPLPEHAAVMAAWGRGERIEWRYRDADDSWRPFIRHQDFGYGEVLAQPNWQNEDIEFRVAPTK